MLDEFSQFMTTLAEQSGKLIEQHFLSSSLNVELKADRSVVTQADRDAETLIRDAIRRVYPSHGIIGEEFGSENEDGEFVWVIDPIDGTISFVGGAPLFGTLIGLLHKGEPILGCIHQPVVKLLCLGDGKSTRLNGKLSRVRNTENLSEAVMLVTDRSNVGKFQRLGPYAGLEEDVKLVRTWGDCYGYLLVAGGRADIMLDPIMNPWDILPLIPVIRGAGGIITGWQGEPPEKAKSAVAASPALHPLVLKRLHSESPVS